MGKLVHDCMSIGDGGYLESGAEVSIKLPSFQALGSAISSKVLGRIHTWAPIPDELPTVTWGQLLAFF